MNDLAFIGGALASLYLIMNSVYLKYGWIYLKHKTISLLPSYRIVSLSEFISNRQSYREVKFLTGKEKGKSILIQRSSKPIDETHPIMVGGRDVYFERHYFPAVVIKPVDEYAQSFKYVETSAYEE